jgi:single-stranded DNA-binding protein
LRAHYSTPNPRRSVYPDVSAKCTFSLGSEPDAPSVPIIVYGRLATFCAKNLFQGSVNRVVGHIAQDVDATATTGTFRLHVVAEHVEIKPSSSRKLPTEETANVF